MSSEAFVYFLRDGEPSTVSSQRVREAFGAFLTEGGGYDWHLHYDDENNCDVMLKVDDADPNLIQNLTMIRPCADVRLWDALASVLHLGHAALFFSSGPPLLIADAKTAQHLPEGMTESLGKPKRIRTGADILREMQECFDREP